MNSGQEESDNLIRVLSKLNKHGIIHTLAHKDEILHIATFHLGLQCLPNLDVSSMQRFKEALL